MRVLLGRSAALALCLCALPLAAQEDGSTDSVDLQEQLALDTNALAVLPIEILTTDPRAPALAAEAYEAILNQLAAIEGLYVIGRESVLPYADSALPAVEIARELGVGTILESSIRAEPIGILLDVDLIDAQTGEESHGSAGLLELNPNVQIVDPPFNLDTLMPDMASRIAEQVESTLFPTAKPQADPQQVIAEAQAMVLDASLSDSERLDALKKLPSRSEELRSDAVVIAAAQIAMSSDASRVRAGVWREMAGVDDPYLVQPLLHSLANDIDEDVRRVAAETLLRGFLDEPDVRGALEYAAENDASEWVRNEIRLSMLSETERQEELRATVLDTTKTDRERSLALGNLWMGMFRNSNPEALSGEVVVAMVEMARTSNSPRIRSEVWSYLNGTSDPYLVQPLLDALANDSDERVRDAAAKGLTEFLAESGVHEALEQARVNDASPLVRKTVNEALETVNR